MRGNVEQRECFSFDAIESAGSPAQADSRKLKALLILFRVVPCLRLPRELLTSRLQRASSCLPSARGFALTLPLDPRPGPVFLASRRQPLLRLRACPRSAVSKSPGSCPCTSQGPIHPPAP